MTDDSKAPHKDDTKDDALDAALCAAFRLKPPPDEFIDHCVYPPLASLLNVLPNVEFTRSGRERFGLGPVAHRFHRYELYDEIGSGGMGTVYRGRDLELGRELAIKVLRKGHTTALDAQKRFVTEARISGQLQHPGIPPVYELGEFHRGQPYLTMKLVQGQTLSAKIAGCNDLAGHRRTFLDVLEQVCQTLAFAHSQGVIHRDLKPSNVMVGSFGEVLVMDWGLAKILRPCVAQQENEKGDGTIDAKVDEFELIDPDPTKTNDGSLLGTPAYIAPEQARGQSSLLDERTDVFGLGAMLCEILTGQPPYTGKRTTELLSKAAEPDLGDAFHRLDCSGADEELVRLAKHCLSPNPNERPRDAGAVANAIAGWHSSLEDRLRESDLRMAASRATAKHERRLRWMAITLAIVVTMFAVTGVGLWQWVNYERHRRELAEAQRQQAEEQEQKEELQRQLTKELARVAALQKSVFGGVNLAKIAELPGGFDTVLASAEGLIDVALAENPHLEIAARQLLSNVYTKRNEIDLAIKHAERAVQLLNEHVGHDHRMTLESNAYLTRLHDWKAAQSGIVVDGHITQTIEPGNRSPHGDFVSIAPPSSSDYADASKGQVVIRLTGELHDASGDVSILCDGSGQSNNASPTESVIFADDVESGRIMMDLGQVVSVTRINSFTWMLDDRRGGLFNARSPQRYTVYGCSQNRSPSAFGDLVKNGWEPITRVDTDKTFRGNSLSDPAGWRPQQQAVSITGSDGRIASVRFLLFELRRPTEGESRQYHSAIGEIDVYVDEGNVNSEITSASPNSGATQPE